MKRTLILGARLAFAIVTGYVVGALLCIGLASTWLLHNGYMSKDRRHGKALTTTRYP
jgi:hypothetical protein